MSVLKLEHVKKDFTLRNGLKTTTIHAVKDASFELASDKTIALVGESGSGKSTIAPWCPPEAVSIWLMVSQLPVRCFARETVMPRRDGMALKR